MDKQTLQAKQEHGEDNQQLSCKTEKIPERPKKTQLAQEPGGDQWKHKSLLYKPRSQVEIGG